MKRRLDAKPMAMIALAGAILAGCATPSTIESRKRERYGAYAALAPEMRTLVDEGQVAAGMNPDAVYIAWGKPGQVAGGGSEAGLTTTWFYYRTYVHQTWISGYHRGYYVSDPRAYVSKQVKFMDGAVKEWQTFPAPW